VAARRGGRSSGSGKTKAKSSGKNVRKRKIRFGVLFWVIFFLVMAGLFLVNREVIRRTLRNTQVFPGSSDRGAPEDVPENTPGPSVTVAPGSPEPDPVSPLAAPPSAPPPAARLPESAPDRTGEGAKPPAAVTPPAAARPAPAPSAVPAESRGRTLYFTRIDKDGSILRTKAARTIPVSDSPMVDALKMLIQGPSAEEQRQGLVTLIPQGTRILTARVQGNTAYISFSEEFQYNIYGVEGYAAQIRQVVWTATEFPGVKDVQILIEGRRVDYLGEGIWIGSPVSRDDL
jgi:hypothetical protein